jgi:2-haloalkanoic acid dehalogenase type II
MSGFDRYRTLSFDCYGTLIDWETGLTTALRKWTGSSGHTDDELLALVARFETIIQQEMPTTKYPEVLAEVLRRIGRELGVAVDEADASTFGASVGDWPAFSDSAGALARLKGKFRLVILSNVDKASFAESNRKLGVDFDLVVTAEDVGSYKPDPANFQAMFDRLSEIGTDRSELLHVAQSLFHDHVPAQRLGLETVWIDRQGGRDGATPTAGKTVIPTWTFPSLESFADSAT